MKRLKNLTRKNVAIGLSALILIVAGGIFTLRQSSEESKKDDNGSSNNGSQISDLQELETKKDSQNQSVSLKEYKNLEYGFSFQYPADWAIKEDLQVRRGAGSKKEGVITVTSPESTVVEFYPNMGGRGGGCGEPLPTDKPHQTERCSTLELLSKLEITNTNPKVYLYKFRHTGPQKAESEYGAALSTSQEIAAWAVNEPKIEAYSTKGIVSVNTTTNVDTALKSPSAASPSVFETSEFKQAYDILKSFKLF